MTDRRQTDQSLIRMCVGEPRNSLAVVANAGKRGSLPNFDKPEYDIRFVFRWIWERQKESETETKSQIRETVKNQYERKQGKIPEVVANAKRRH